MRQRRLLLATTAQAMLAKFSGNVLGAAWLLLYPLVFLSMYSLVFIYILMRRSAKHLQVSTQFSKFLGFSKIRNSEFPEIQFSNFRPTRCC